MPVVGNQLMHCADEQSYFGGGNSNLIWSRISFNDELLTAPTNVRRRVIVEELLHLKIPNHGKLFKALLRAYLKE